MKSSKFIVILACAGLGIAALVNAADTKAPAAGAVAAAPARTWTEADVKSLCHFRAKGDATKESGCLQRYLKKMPGKPMSDKMQRNIAAADRAAAAAKKPAQ